MRVTDHRIVDISAAATQRDQAAVADVTQQLSSGLRVAKPSDDPSAWIAAQREKVRAALNDGTSHAIQVGSERLAQTDGVLATIGGIVSQARQLAVEGANDTQSATSRSDIGAQLSSLFDAAVAAANTTDPNGEYVLAGTKSLTQPFDTTTGAYSGDSTARGVNTDTTSTQIATAAGSGLTAANGVDVLPLLKTLATAMNANDPVTVRVALGDLDTAVKQISQVRGQTGAHMAVLSSAKAAHDALATQIQTAISDNVEIDAVSAASQLAKASQALTVSQTVTTHVLSLLNPNK